MAKQYMKEKNTGKKTKVEFVDKTRNKKTLTPTKRPLTPTKRPLSTKKALPNFLSDTIADAVKRTNKAKKEGRNFTKKNGLVQKSKKSEGVAVGKVINPFPKKSVKKTNRDQMTAHQKRKDKLRNLGKQKPKVTQKPKFHDAVFKTKKTPKHLQKNIKREI